MMTKYQASLTAQAALLTLGSVSGALFNTQLQKTIDLMNSASGLGKLVGDITAGLGNLFSQPTKPPPTTVTKHVGKGGYADGGFTGHGPKNEEAGPVHRGEYVIPAEGAPIMVSPKMTELLQKIHDELQAIHSDGGNAVINIHTTNKDKAMAEGGNLYNRTFNTWGN
jgi:hypothetical protein